MSDRRLWLDEVCPDCRAAPGLRCQTHSYKGKPLLWLHAARGWRQRPCPTCKAAAGEACTTPTGRLAGRLHTARLRYGRREPTTDWVWEELERWQAAIAIVRFSAGSGKPGSIAAVTLEDAAGHEVTRWSSGEGLLPDELAAPIWGRYGLFRGHPRIVGMVLWDLPNREVLSSGTRGEQRFDEVLIPRPRAPLPLHSDTSRDTLPVAAVPESPARASRDTSPAASVAGADASRSCERCGQPLASDLRPEARFCSKRCRQAASRERLKTRPSLSPPPTPATRCAWCAGPMPAGRRPEARFCSKRCRQASSRHSIAAQRTFTTTPGPRDTSTASTAKATSRSRHG